MAAPPKSRKPAATRPARPFAPPAWTLLAVLVVATMVVHRHTLQAYFALDDLVMFQQAHGIRPWPLTAWRWLSGWAWFRAVVPFWGDQPFPYHAMSLLLHVTNALLLMRLARRWGASVPAAWMASGLFAFSRLHFPALLAATSIGELLSLTFLLVALAVASPRADREPVTGTLPQPDARTPLALAVLAIALAVSAKESVMLVPLAALLIVPSPTASPETASAATASNGLLARARPLLPVLLTGSVLGMLLLISGLGSGRLGGQAYSISFGFNALENVARLAGWSLDLIDPIPDLHASTAGVAKFVVPAVALALTLLAGFRGGPLARAGAAWWWLAVLPVLPLPGRTYLHYLYVPLAGLALASAGAFDAWNVRAEKSARKRSGRRAWVVAALLLLVYGAWSDVLLSMRMDLRMPSVDWPLDPVLRKSEIARRSIGDVGRYLSGRHANVAILIPAATSRPVDLGTGRVVADSVAKRYALREVLDDGRSLRAMVRSVDSVVIVHDFEPGRAGWEYFVSQADSHVLPMGPLPLGHARLVQGMLSLGLNDLARDYAQKALAADPGDTAMRDLLGTIGPGAPR